MAVIQAEIEQMTIPEEHLLIEVKRNGRWVKM